MGAGSAGPLVHRGGSAMHEHAYGVEKRRCRLCLPCRFPASVCAFPSIGRTRFLSRVEPMSLTINVTNSAVRTNPAHWQRRISRVGNHVSVVSQRGRFPLPSYTHLYSRVARYEK